MSVVDRSTIWVSGTEGKVGLTTDQGQHWKWTTVPGYDSCDWRTIVAFSNKRALLLNAGEPAHLMLTTDAGETWKEVYTDNTKGIFFDGMAFRNGKEGIAIGDPIDGHFTMIRTGDSGKTWQPVPLAQRPEATEGEAIFAASGTSVRTLPDGKVCFVTGGTNSRFIKGWNKWTPAKWDFTHGSGGKGAFSVAFADKLNGIAVGGDYMQDGDTTNNCLITRDGGLTWHQPTATTHGYKSCVQYLGRNIFVATGTSGTDISFDGGESWASISKEGFHVAGVDAKGGSLIWLAGSKKIAWFSPYKR